MKQTTKPSKKIKETVGKNIVAAPFYMRALILGLFILCLMLPAGCARTGERAGYGLGDDAEAALGELDDEIPDELVEAPDLPQDDGIPLSFAERIAFRSTGFLDMNLSPDEMTIVERHFKYYLHEHRRTLERYLARAEAILPHLRQVFMETGVPEEIIYLAAVESGFNPKAVSRAGAAGVWQFMPSTGRHYGLTQNYWIDERRDPFKSTRAAAAYLKYLNARFDDWHLAIAAYNAGENKIERALRNTGARSFFELCVLNDNISDKSRLKLETQQYVPRLLAMVKIMRNLEILGLTPPDERPLNHVSVSVGPGTDLGALAANSGLRLDEFKALNPAYRFHISPPGSSSTAYVPKENSSRAETWLTKAGSSRFAGWQRYQIRRGDSLSTLAQRHGVSAGLILQANNLKGNSLREGNMLLLPGTRAALRASSSLAASGRSGQVIAAGSTIHTVQRGDSLYSIARAYGVKLENLRQANNMRPHDNLLTVGQKIGIPPKTGSAQRGSGGSEGRFIVRKGDTLYSIAAQNNTSVAELIRLNGLRANKPIQPGQEIILP
ncbi:MAG: LysM peptidoglycan-binding domain-containing protein [Deltaproteobacteria bacterium]|jgi:membrane-bound lytic murein transglycosylase D|nr:LysM peptidoglycan-binding domain-containing protein [Deltaproteobacteria bacterium]